MSDFKKSAMWPTPDMCLAQEWHRDGRGLWAMRSCQYYTGHGKAHAFGSWKYNVEPQALDVDGGHSEHPSPTTPANPKDDPSNKADVGVGEAGARLRAEVTTLKDAADTLAASLSDGDQLHALWCGKSIAYEVVLKRLDALLSAPVVVVEEGRWVQGIDGAWTKEGTVSTPLSADPVVDLTNHHNALTCPYCNPKGLVLSAPVVSPPQEALEVLERELARMDRVSFVVDLQHVTSKKHSGGMAVVVDLSDAMHALLFVRQALRSAPRGGGETP